MKRVHTCLFLPVNLQNMTLGFSFLPFSLSVQLKREFSQGFSSVDHHSHISVVQFSFSFWILLRLHYHMIRERYCLFMVVARSFFQQGGQKYLTYVNVHPFGFHNAPWSDQCSRCHFHSGEPFDSLSSRTLTSSVLLSGLCVSRGRRIQCDWVRVYYILPQQQSEVEWNNKGTFFSSHTNNVF